MGIRILLVEDDEVNRVLLEDYLVMLGYEVTSLDCGQHFFEALFDFHPQLILLDLVLPDVSGYKILELMQESTWQSIPVIVISALAFKSERDRALKLGIRRYLVKPMGLDELSNAIIEELTR